MLPQLPFSTVLIVAFVSADLVLIFLVLRVVLRMEWNALSARFPARSPEENAVRRRFQSVTIGGANFGLCFQIAVDDRALHLSPGFLLRACGARGISVPWAYVSPGERRRVFGTEQMDASIGDSVVTGPAWCLEPARVARPRS